MIQINQKNQKIKMIIKKIKETAQINAERSVRYFVLCDKQALMLFNYLMIPSPQIVKSVPAFSILMETSSSPEVS